MIVPNHFQLLCDLPLRELGAYRSSKDIDSHGTVLPRWWSTHITLRRSALDYETTRRAPRYSLALDVEITDVQSGSQINARTENLSLFGCGVRGASYFPRGARVTIKLFHRGLEVTAIAKVVYATPELGMGFVFSFIDPDDHLILDGWIKEMP